MKVAGRRDVPDPELEGRRRGKVLFVITSLDFGGAEAVVVQIATQLALRGWDATVVTMTQPRAYEDRLASSGIKVYSLGMKRGVPDPRALFALARIYRTLRPDIVHAHMVHANLLARLARLVTPVPALLSAVHSVEEGGAAHYLGYRLTDPMSEFTTSVSQAGVERYRALRAVKATKSGYMPNAVDLEKFSRNQKVRDEVRRQQNLGGEFIWLAVGRLTELKDYPNLLHAFTQVSTGSRLWIVGDGELRASVAKLIGQLGIGGRVDLLGLRTDVDALMSAADGFVLSSSVEGLPMVLLEAAASALPAVATNVGGVSQIVDAASGILVEPKDPAALASGMLELEQSSVLAREEMGRRGRERALGTFDVSVVMSAWEALFQYAIGVSRGKRTRLAHRLNPEVVSQQVDMVAR